MQLKMHYRKICTVGFLLVGVAVAQTEDGLRSEKRVEKRVSLNRADFILLAGCASPDHANAIPGRSGLLRKACGSGRPILADPAE